MIHCRPGTKSDEPFLRRLIVETISEELAAWAWPDPVREQLLETQYRIRRQGVAANYPTAEVSVIEADGQPVGWIVTVRSETDLQILEIAVLPQARGKGIGGAVLRDLIEAADRGNVPVRLNVNTGNRAIRLYERLGFRRTGGSEVQHFMRRDASRLSI